MSLINRLSSQIGDKTQQGNVAVAERIMADPSGSGLEEVAAALESPAGQDAAFLGDCCEVLTKVAERQPERVAPYAPRLLPLLGHKTTRVRWEAMHALALTAERVPDLMAGALPTIAELIRRDASTIVRDYAVDTFGNMARAGEAAARQAYPVLREALRAADGKHAGRALAGLCHAVQAAPDLALEALQTAHEYADHAKPAVRKAAKALLKAAQR